MNYFSVIAMCFLAGFSSLAAVAQGSSDSPSVSGSVNGETTFYSLHTQSQTVAGHMRVTREFASRGPGNAWHFEVDVGHVYSFDVDSRNVEHFRRPPVKCSSSGLCDTYGYESTTFALPSGGFKFYEYVGHKSPLGQEIERTLTLNGVQYAAELVSE